MALLSINEARFRKPVLPGMDLEINVECVKARGIVYGYKAFITWNGQLMSEASILATIKI